MRASVLFAIAIIEAVGGSDGGKVEMDEAGETNSHQSTAPCPAMVTALNRTYSRQCCAPDA